MRYGTYTTLDTPTENQQKAKDFLIGEFEKIGVPVREIINPHDFGNYPSFEIDYPYHLEDLNDDDESGDNISLLDERDEWHDKANKIESEYNNLFFNDQNMNVNETIDVLLDIEIERRIKECDGLYTEKELEVLKPIWFKQMKADVTKEITSVIIKEE